MAIRFSVRDFAEGLTSAATGMIAGEIQGQEIARQRQVEEFGRIMAADQARQQQEHAARTQALGLLDKVDPASQGALLQYGMGQPQNPFAATLNTPYAQRTPGIREALARPVAPAPSVKPKGISKEAVAARVKERDRVLQLLRDQTGATDDPRVLGDVQGLIEGLSTLDLTSKEGFDASGSLLSRAAAYGPGGSLGAQRLRAGQRDDQVTAYKGALDNLQKAPSGRGAIGYLRQMRGLEAAGAKMGDLNVIPQTLAAFTEDMEEMERLSKANDEDGAARIAARVKEQIRSGVDPRQEGQRLTQLIQFSKALPAKQASDPAFMRGVYERFGLGHLLPEDPKAAPYLGGARAEERLHQLIQKMSTPQFALLDWPSQRPLLDELTGLSKLLGKPLQIPAKVVANLTPYQIQRLRLDQAKFTYTKTRNAQKDKEDQEALGKLSGGEREALRLADGEVRRRQANLNAYMRENDIVPSEVDETTPKDDYESEYLHLRNLLDQAEGERDRIYRGHGIATPEIDQSDRPGPMPRPPKVEPPPKKTPLQQAGEAIGGAYRAVTGQPAKPAPKKAPRQMTDEELRRAYEAAKARKR